MCKWGDTVKLRLIIPARLSHTGKDRYKMVSIDKCIVPLVKALNKEGLQTNWSCCRHLCSNYVDIGLEYGRRLKIYGWTDPGKGWRWRGIKTYWREIYIRRMLRYGLMTSLPAEDLK